MGILSGIQKQESSPFRRGSSIKTDFIKTIELTITQLNKLAMINPAAKNDDNYNRLLSKYIFFKETLEYCDPEKIITGYIRPVVNKYISEITWRRL